MHESATTFRDRRIGRIEHMRSRRRWLRALIVAGLLALGVAGFAVQHLRSAKRRTEIAHWAAAHELAFDANGTAAEQSFLGGWGQ